MDTFHLERFVQAQEGVYPHALREMVNGEKGSHWIWFIFPQLKALGKSGTAIRFGITGLPEARAYLAHPVLGPRLLEITKAVVSHRDKTAKEIFNSAVMGPIDAKKFHSSMTLFREAAPEEPIFDEALKLFYKGKPDGYTLSLLKGDGGNL